MCVRDELSPPRLPNVIRAHHFPVRTPCVAKAVESYPNSLNAECSTVLLYKRIYLFRYMHAFLVTLLLSVPNMLTLASSTGDTRVIDGDPVATLNALVTPVLRTSDYVLLDHHDIVVPRNIPAWIYLALQVAEGQESTIRYSLLIDRPSSFTCTSRSIVTLFYIHPLRLPEYRQMLQWMYDESSDASIETCLGVLERIDPTQYRDVTTGCIQPMTTIVQRLRVLPQERVQMEVDECFPSILRYRNLVVYVQNATQMQSPPRTSSSSRTEDPTTQSRSRRNHTVSDGLFI